MERDAAVSADHESRVVQLPPLSIRADVVPRTVSEDDRSVEVIITTGAGVRRMDYWTGKPYIEVLSLDPSAIRLDRLNQGAPLLDSHAAYSVADMLGAVVPGSVEMTKTAMVGRVRFSRRAAVEPVWQDVRDGLIRNVSIGYRVYRFEEKPGKTEGAPPIRTAIDWEPFEVSMVPIPADAGAKVRSGETSDANQCEIVSATRTASPAPQQPAAEAPAAPQPAAPAAVPAKEKQMERSETIVERPAADNPAPRSTEPTSEERAAAIERERCQGIYQACRTARLPVSFADKMIGDNVSLNDARGKVLAEIEARGVPGVPEGRPAVEITGGDDPLVHQRKHVEAALLHRVAPQFFKLPDEARNYRGMSLMDLAEIFLRARGARVESLGKMERAALALGMRGGMHSTSDFPNLLADVANKTLRAAYDAAPQTWLPLARQVNLSDFKASNQLQIGDAPGLLEVGEHGEFKAGSITEGKEALRLKTYGRIFAITRQALINDDLNAFAQVPAAFGRKARDLESDLAWAEITSNPDMGDTVDLFHATHNNLDSVGAAISVESIGAGRAAMRVQVGLDGVTMLNLTPRYLIVPAALETKADQFVSAVLNPAAASNVNPFAGRLMVIAEPRLDASDDEAWYLATDQAQAPVLYYGVLDGQTGPTVDQELGFEVDGLKLKCRHDVAFKAADWRAIFKNAGVSET